VVLLGSRVIDHDDEVHHHSVIEVIDTEVHARVRSLVLDGSRVRVGVVYDIELVVSKLIVSDTLTVFHALSLTSKYTVLDQVQDGDHSVGVLSSIHDLVVEHVV
jgi:hypothetical protein